jgi:hypothetical protein
MKINFNLYNPFSFLFSKLKAAIFWLMQPPSITPKKPVEVPSEKPLFTVDQHFYVLFKNQEISLNLLEGLLKNDLSAKHILEILNQQSAVFEKSVGALALPQNYVEHYKRIQEKFKTLANSANHLRSKKDYELYSLREELRELKTNSTIIYALENSEPLVTLAVIRTLVNSYKEIFTNSDLPGETKLELWAYCLTKLDSLPNADSYKNTRHMLREDIIFGITIVKQELQHAENTKTGALLNAKNSPGPANDSSKNTSTNKQFSVSDFKFVRVNGILELAPIEKCASPQILGYTASENLSIFLE